MDRIVKIALTAAQADSLATALAALQDEGRDRTSPELEELITVVDEAIQKSNTTVQATGLAGKPINAIEQAIAKAKEQRYQVLLDDDGHEGFIHGHEHALELVKATEPPKLATFMGLPVNPIDFKSNLKDGEELALLPLSGYRKPVIEEVTLVACKAVYLVPVPGGTYDQLKAASEVARDRLAASLTEMGIDIGNSEIKAEWSSTVHAAKATVRFKADAQDVTYDRYRETESVLLEGLNLIVIKSEPWPIQPDSSCGLEKRLAYAALSVGAITLHEYRQKWGE